MKFSGDFRTIRRTNLRLTLASHYGSNLHRIFSFIPLCLPSRYDYTSQELLGHLVNSLEIRTLALRAHRTLSKATVFCWIEDVWEIS